METQGPLCCEERILVSILDFSITYLHALLRELMQDDRELKTKLKYILRLYTKKLDI